VLKVPRRSSARSDFEACRADDRVRALLSDHEGVDGLPLAIPMNERLLVAVALSNAPLPVSAAMRPLRSLSRSSLLIQSGRSIRWVILTAIVRGYRTPGLSPLWVEFGHLTGLSRLLRSGPPMIAVRYSYPIRLFDCRRSSSSVRIGIPRLQDCIPCATQSFRVSMISSGVAPAARAPLM
jgi:hypothetical protein